MYNQGIIFWVLPFLNYCGSFALAARSINKPISFCQKYEDHIKAEKQAENDKKNLEKLEIKEQQMKEELVRAEELAVKAKRLLIVWLKRKILRVKCYKNQRKIKRFFLGLHDGCSIPVLSTRPQKSMLNNRFKYYIRLNLVKLLYEHFLILSKWRDEIIDVIFSDSDVCEHMRSEGLTYYFYFTLKCVDSSRSSHLKSKEAWVNLKLLVYWSELNPICNKEGMACFKKGCSAVKGLNFPELMCVNPWLRDTSITI